MLNPFPDLLSYSLLAPFILRVVLGFLLLDLGFLKFKGERLAWTRIFEAFGLEPAKNFVIGYALIEIIAGGMLVIGLYTQIAALAVLVLAAVGIYFEYKDREILKRDIVFYSLIAAIAFSLLLSGAGAFAFDIPL